MPCALWSAECVSCVSTTKTYSLVSKLTLSISNLQDGVNMERGSHPFVYCTVVFVQFLFYPLKISSECALYPLLSSYSVYGIHEIFMMFTKRISVMCYTTHLKGSVEKLDNPKRSKVNEHFHIVKQAIIESSTVETVYC